MTSAYSPPGTDKKWQILAHVNVDSVTGCWLWRRGVSRGGYGRMTVGKKKQEYTHRVAWEAWRGPIPAGLHVLHRCDTPPCCNPAHLFVGTARDNSLDMVAKRRAGPWRHPECIPRGERAGPAKLTEVQARAILARRRGGAKSVDLAAEFSVTPATVRMIASGRTWRHLGQEELYARVGS